VSTPLRQLVREGAKAADNHGRLPDATIRTLLNEPPRLYTFAEMLEQPAIEWLLGGLIPSGSLATLTGKWGAGKSFLATAWVLCVGTDRSWLGRDVQGGGCLYVAAEGCRPERLRAYVERWPLPMEPRVWWRKQELPLADAAQIDAILRQVDGLPNAPRLIVLDTWARCTVGLQENDASDTAIAVTTCARLQRETGAAVLALHHPPHNTPDRGRGSSALDAAADTCLLLAEKDGALSLRVTKQKDGEPGAPIGLRLAPCGPSVVVELDDGTSHDFTASEAEALDALRRIAVPGGVTATEWRKATGLPERTFYDARGKLVQRGTVQKDKSKYRTPDTATAEVLQ
jgi:AAA domain